MTVLQDATIVTAAVLSQALLSGFQLSDSDARLLLSDITTNLADCERGRSRSFGCQHPGTLTLGAGVPESRLWKCGAVEQRHLHTRRIKDESVTFPVNFSLRTPWILWN